jgi:hypothetical protein
VKRVVDNITLVALLLCIGVAGCTPRTEPADPTDVTDPPPPADDGAAPTDTAAAEDEHPPLAPAPIPEGERLSPCSVELELMVRDEESEEEDSWQEHRIAVSRLVRRWEGQRFEVDFQSEPIAPIPLTRDQALAMLPGAEASRIGDVEWILAQTGESSLSYRFDDQGRTTEVDFDPVADSRVFAFHYSYECEGEPVTPAWDE